MRHFLEPGRQASPVTGLPRRMVHAPDPASLIPPSRFSLPLPTARDAAPAAAVDVPPVARAADLHQSLTTRALEDPVADELHGILAAKFWRSRERANTMSVRFGGGAEVGGAW